MTSTASTPAVLAERHVQGPVAAGETRLHVLDLRNRDPEFGRHLDPSVEGRAVAFRLDPSAQPPEVEEEGFLRGGGAGTHDRPVAEHVVLERGPYPPAGVGREADVTLRLELRGGLQQAEIAFLHQVSHGQAMVAELDGLGDDEADMGPDQAVQGLLVPIAVPTFGELALFFPGQDGHAHRALDKMTVRLTCLPRLPQDHTTNPLLLN